MFVCWIYPPNHTQFNAHVIYGKKRNLLGEVPIEKSTQSQQRFSVYERKRNSRIFLPRFSYQTSQAIFRFFFVYLTSRASDTLKVQTDYLTFGNLITTSGTPQVQSSEAIAVEEYLLKIYAAIIIVFFSFKQDTSPEY